MVSRARFLESIADVDAAEWNALSRIRRRRAAPRAHSRSCATNSCSRSRNPAAPRRVPAGRPSISVLEDRRGRAHGRAAAVPQGAFPRRVRVRLLLGQRLRPARPQVLPEAPVGRAVHAGERPAPAGELRGRRARRSADALDPAGERVRPLAKELSSWHVLVPVERRARAH